jgi:anti-sigma regulatory factor (Ser/Thr protein kinase)
VEVAVPNHLDHESGVAIAIDDPSKIGEARRSANAVAAAIGLSETDAGRFAILASEAATNITKHAGHGDMVIRSLGAAGRLGAEVIAIDAGPGIPDLQRALADGYSTAGSPGTGLGAIARLATAFDIYTAAGAGTVLVARVFPARTATPEEDRRFEIGAVRVAKRGEYACGDDWRIAVTNGRAMLAVADGLGHGQSAAEASRRAVDAAVERSAGQPGMIVAHVHSALRSTRGAALAIAELDSTAASVRYAGLGNISASIVSTQDSKSLVSYNGIAGHEARKIQEFVYDWPPGALLVVHSDGLSGRWDLARYPGLAFRDPSVVAGVLYRDFSRGRDDALVVVVRAAARTAAEWRGSGPPSRRPRS